MIHESSTLIGCIVNKFRICDVCLSFTCQIKHTALVTNIVLKCRVVYNDKTIVSVDWTSIISNVILIERILVIETPCRIHVENTSKCANIAFWIHIVIATDWYRILYIEESSILLLLNFEIWIDILRGFNCFCIAFKSIIC